MNLDQLIDFYQCYTLLALSWCIEARVLLFLWVLHVYHFVLVVRFDAQRAVLVL